MFYSNPEITLLFKDWLNAWNNHDLDGVMKLMHEDIIFENWTNAEVIGKKLLRKLWTPWFLNHGDFKFFEENLIFDENKQILLFMWRLVWPSLITKYKGKEETRWGVDIIHFKDGKIIHKISYSKTTILIEDQIVSLEKL